MARYTFDQTIELLDGLYHRPVQPARTVGLARVAYLLEQIGNPHLSFRSVHVAGSTGKGSTTSMIGSIVQSSGFRTGYFRSPHLEEYTERIAVDGKDIGRDEWARCFEQVWPAVEAMESKQAANYQLGRPTFFEVIFALMATYFREMGVHWAAVETGLGGRFDATNVLQSDVAVVTNVSLEHTQVLGKTVAAIAAEKAAIIKPGSQAVTAAEDPEAIRVIEAQAQRVGAPLIRVGRDARAATRSARIDGQQLTLEGGESPLEVSLPLAAPFQAANAATAFAAALALRRRGVSLPDEAVVRGFESVRVPGRFELISRAPAVLLDGAHNPAGARELRRAVQELLADRRRIVLFATMADKDVRSVAAEIGPLADELVVTSPPGTERAAPPEVVVPAFEPWVSSIRAEADVDRALAMALEAARPESILIVTGSLYLVGHVRHVLTAAPVSP